MKLQKFRWSKVYESSEEELVEFLRVRDIAAERWAAEEFEAAEPRTVSMDTTLWCAEGSLTLTVEGNSRSVQPGDAVHIPAGASLQTTAGMSGCVCYEGPTKLQTLGG